MPEHDPATTQSTPTTPATPIDKVHLKVGLEVHIELATQRKMFSRAPSIACPQYQDALPNTLIDPVVLALPGSLPVMNKSAIEMSMLVGLALNCSIARQTKWDRKSYFYPDLPKAYQLSQYDLPLCFDGSVDVPALDNQGRFDLDAPTTRIGILRAHLEEDAGKLLHELPGGGKISSSIVDYNRAGTPLLEVVTQPDFTTPDQVVAFAQLLHLTCTFLGVTLGNMQRGHMRFEPNINCILHTKDGNHTQQVQTPIVEVKNLNSFRALRGAIEYEHQAQPSRWQRDQLIQGPGTKSTRGWDDQALKTIKQREKEDADDYRYFPDPDLAPVQVSDQWLEQVRARLTELPLKRAQRYTIDFALRSQDSLALVQTRSDCDLFESSVEHLVAMGIARASAGIPIANLLLQVGTRLANQKNRALSQLGITPHQVAQIAAMRLDNSLSKNAADELFQTACTNPHPDSDLAQLAQERNLLTITDESQLAEWVAQVIADNQSMAQQVRDGNDKPIGRLIGEVKKLSQGSADAARVRELLLAKLRN